jgi:hypothetical protein
MTNERPSPWGSTFAARGVSLASSWSRARGGALPGAGVPPTVAPRGSGPAWWVGAK